MKDSSLTSGQGLRVFEDTLRCTNIFPGIFKTTFSSARIFFLPRICFRFSMEKNITFRKKECFKNDFQILDIAQFWGCILKPKILCQVTTAFFQIMKISVQQSSWKINYLKYDLGNNVNCVHSLSDISPFPILYDFQMLFLIANKESPFIDNR